MMQHKSPQRTQLAQVVLSLVLGGGILWWMYRGFSAEEFGHALRNEVEWFWMIASLPFGVTACWFRAMRWRQLMRPLGQLPRRHVATCAIFISYASSLVVPRSGEVLRCAVLSRYEGANFTQSVGTVVTERAVDSTLLLLLALVAFVCQADVFLSFFNETGMGIMPIIGRFTATGWIVTAICLLVTAALGTCLIRRLSVWSRVKHVMSDLTAGIMSVRGVDNKPLFLLYSIGIWASYFLHFYVTFYCFEQTATLGPAAALVAFVVGSFAVLVPTPNGAGAWHFATKTVLVLYGVAQSPAAMAVLIVHTIQTLLVALLGLYAIAALQLARRK